MYKLIHGSPELLVDARTQWLELTDNLGEIGPLARVDIENKLRGLEKQNESPDFYVYCLVDKHAESKIQAVLQIVHAKPLASDNWLKILDITLRPDLSFDYSQDVTDTVAMETMRVLSHAMVWSISLIFKDFDGAGSIKIYGRTDFMRDMFLSLLATGDIHRELEPIGVSARKEGGWLVFEKKLRKLN